MKHFLLALGAQVLITLAKNAKTYPTYDITHKILETQNLKFFSLQIRRLAE